MTAPSKRKLKTACETLGKTDKALARAYDEIGVPQWRSAEPSYAMVGRMIAHQQLSTTAAATIWGRVLEKYGENLTPSCVLAAPEDDLRACGLSRPKIRHLKSIATSIESGDLCFDRLRNSDLDDARKELIAVKGIGPWTAELFLLYAVGEMDAFPTSDVGLMESHKRLSHSKNRMESKVFTQYAERWRPYRGVAAHLLWGWINLERAKEGKASPQT